MKIYLEREKYQTEIHSIHKIHTIHFWFSLSSLTNNTEVLFDDIQSKTITGKDEGEESGGEEDNRGGGEKGKGEKDAFFVPISPLPSLSSFSSLSSSPSFSQKFMTSISFSKKKRERGMSMGEKGRSGGEEEEGQRGRREGSWGGKVGELFEEARREVVEEFYRSVNDHFCLHEPGLCDFRQVFFIFSLIVYKISI